MVRSRTALVLAMLVAPLLASCGRSDGPPLYPVTGQVVYNGKPAVGANVSLVGDGDGPKGPGNELLVPSGLVDDAGKFALETADFGQGAPVGKYKVLIQWRSRDGEPNAPPGGSKKGSRKLLDKPDGIPDRLNGRYMNPQKSTLHAEIKPEKNDLPVFDVSK